MRIATIDNIIKLFANILALFNIEKIFWTSFLMYGVWGYAYMSLLEEWKLFFY